MDARAGAEGGQDGRAEKVEVGGLTEEGGVVGGEAVGEDGESGAGTVGQEVVAVLLEGGEAKLMNEAGEARGDEALFAIAEVQAEALMREMGDAKKVALLQDEQRLVRRRDEDGLEIRMHRLGYRREGCGASEESAA